MDNNNDLPWDEIDPEESVGKSLLDSSEEKAEEAYERSENRWIEDQKKRADVPDGMLAAPSVDKRAEILANNGKFNFKDIIGNENNSRPDPKSDRNRLHVMDVVFDNGSGRVPYPYFDLFRGTLITHDGEVLNEFTMPSREMLETMFRARLKGQSVLSVTTTYKTWASQRELAKNSMIERVNHLTPNWDGKERIETALIHLFHLRDTPLNRQVGKYFWLSLYNRLVNPGCQAPIAVALIGAQDVGKSYFSTLLCKLLMGDEGAASIPLSLGDIDRNQTQWFRRMIGKSIIANVGELKGLRQTDINAIKDFATRTSDAFDQKFQSAFDIPRQYIIVLDGNSYEGFQRDATGNRRFYPMFCGQVEDSEEGQPQWEGGWKVDFKWVETYIWQLMAEAKAFVDEGGQKAYSEFVGAASKGVGIFSEEEMASGRGIIKDEVTEAGLQVCILKANMLDVSGKTNYGMFITSAELQTQWNKTQKGTINFTSVRRIMTAAGIEYVPIRQDGKLMKGYLWRGVREAHKAKYLFVNGINPKNAEHYEVPAEFDQVLKDALSDGDGGF